MFHMKKLAAALLSALMVIGSCTSAFASEDRTKITSVAFKVDASGVTVGEEGGSIDVEITNSGHYSYSSYYFDDDSNTWAAGDRPKVYVVFTADSGYYFSSPSVTVKGDADYSSKKTQDEKETLEVLIKLDALEGDYQVEEVAWEDESTPVATWTDEDEAGYYQVRLYCDNKSMGDAVNVSGATSYDFSSRITKVGEYYFKVRVTNKDSSKRGEWSEDSESLDVDEDLLADIKGSAGSSNSGGSSSGGATFSSFWGQDGSGNWHIYYRNGQMVTNCWVCDDAVSSNGQNVWYLIDPYGNMVSAGLVRDSLGNYYSIETNHNGYYGMLRYRSGVYDSISLELEPSHNGRFGAINNATAINVLNSMYGTTDISYISTACVYTSQF